MKIFSFVVLAPVVAGPAVAARGSTARCLRNDRRIMHSDLTRNGLRHAIYFGQSSAPEFAGLVSVAPEVSFE